MCHPADIKLAVAGDTVVDNVHVAPPNYPVSEELVVAVPSGSVI